MAVMSNDFARILEDGLRTIFFNEYKDLPEEYSKIFNVQDSDKAIETDLRMAGFGLWEKKESAGAIKKQDLPSSQALQYIHEEFASGFDVERKMIDDDMYNVIKRLPKELARAGKISIEKNAIKILDNAFDGDANAQVGFDGKALIATNHVRLDGGTMSNRLQAANGAGAADGALSDRNLKAAIIQFKRQVNDKGLQIVIRPKYLIIPPELEFTARTILQSTTVSANGTGSGMTNDKNTLPNLEIIVSNYMSSQTAWFLLDPAVAQLNFFWRIRPEFNAGKVDESTKQRSFDGYMRYSFGYSDYRGIFGSKGTGAA